MKNTFKRYIWLTLPLIFLAGRILTACATPSSAGAMEDLLNKCASNTAYVNQSNMSAAEAATYFADQMQAMDTRNCPPRLSAGLSRPYHCLAAGRSLFCQ